ncbi:MAG TPA: OstA-like protein [Bacteroidia bacterium]|nr:OstA-like protein [Bacteroidia bacterium]
MLLALSLLLLAFPVQAQKEKKKIKFSSDVIEGSKPIGGKETRRLLGNVVFTQDNVTMYCDSAHLFSDNSLDAYSHVHFRQGDSLDLYGDEMKYDGNKKFARLEKNIRLTDKDMTLNTEHMTYDVTEKLATYTEGGTLHSQDNVLTSRTGYYEASSRMMAFKNNVVLTNPKYVMNSDTLDYHTGTKVAYFFGPTWIRDKKNSIYCENGYYDTKNDLARFSRHSLINSGKQSLRGDSVFYDRKAGLGKARGNVTLSDTSQHLDVTGEYATNSEITNISIVTGHALLKQINKKDTLFLHADTLKVVSVIDSAAWRKKTAERRKQNILEPILKDSLPMLRTMFAFHRVKFYKPEVQGKCDSLVYTYYDSTMNMFHEPVLWSDKSQLNAGHVELTMANGEMKLLRMFTNSFIIEQEDTIRYDQIKGKNMVGYFRSNKIVKVFVEGNGQAIYYVKEKNKLTGVNKAECSDLLIYLKNNSVEKITLLNKPDGTLFPPNEMNPKDLRLKEFRDYGALRPKDKNDVFNW